MPFADVPAGDAVRQAVGSVRVKYKLMDKAMQGSCFYPSAEDFPCITNSPLGRDILITAAHILIPPIDILTTLQLTPLKDIVSVQVVMPDGNWFTAKGVVVPGYDGADKRRNEKWWIEMLLAPDEARSRVRVETFWLFGKQRCALTTDRAECGWRERAVKIVSVHGWQ
jgi:hypothetical protein